MDGSMLKIAPSSRTDVGVDAKDELRPVAALDLSAFVRICRRQWPVIAGVALVTVLLGLGYVLTAQPRFTSSALVMIDTRKNQLLSNQQVVGDQLLDASGVESQVEILKSESVALSVIRELKLVDDPEFNGNGGLIRAILGRFFSDDGSVSDYEKERLAVGLFTRGLQVKRVGLTYVIQVDFTSPSATKSAQIVNAISDAFMVNELESRYQATKRASRWLQDRIKELREQASEAEREVQKFRAANNIVDTGRGLLSEQQLGDVNSQLVAARAATAEAKARLDRITEVGASDVPNATVADALKNDVITRLRAQYLDIAAREADWSARYGLNHSAAVNLRNQMREISRSILDEVRRIAETYKSEYEIARARELSLQHSLATLVDSAGTTGQAQVKLRDLESSAQSYRNLYDNFLQRFMEATQQQTFPTTDARLITAATAPLTKSAPKAALILGGSAALGLMMGVAAALARERLDNVFRTTRQLEAETGKECLGILPRISTATPGPGATAQGSGFPGAGPEGDLTTRPPAIARHVLNAPFSRFAETIRGIKVAADLNGLTRRTRVIGMVSAVPNEGKTTISSNLAELMAQTGNKVLLIDGDLRNPSLTKALAPDARIGLVEVLSGQRSLAEVMHTDPETGLRMVPAVLNGRIWHTAEMLSSNAMAALLEAARAEYDYIVIDLPPVVPVVDVRAVAPLIDGFVMVVEWGVTSRDVVKEAIATVEPLSERMIGIVLNKASPAMLKRLESYKGRYYKSYYRDSTDVAA